MSEHPTKTANARIDLEAAEWLVRRDHGFTPQEQAEFDRWLEADPRHAEWFARHEATWAEFDALAACRPRDRAEQSLDLPAPAPPLRRWVLPTALVAAASLAFGLFLWRPWTREAPVSASPVVVAQDYQRRTLEDGSTVELNRGAAVYARFTPAERRVLLVRGEAHFTVTKNPQRPFIVQVGDVEVRAVGTVFDVHLEQASVDVFVTEGHVRVNQPLTRGLELPILAAGERTIVPLAPTAKPSRVTQVSSAEMARLLSWRQCIFDFASTPLADVVARFNARNRIQLIIADPELRSLPIVASFRSDNVEGFVRLLEVTAGVQADRPNADEIVLRRLR